MKLKLISRISQSILNPKLNLPREILWYFFASQAILLGTFILLRFTPVDPLSCVVFGIIVGAIFYLAAFVVNNLLFRRDAILLGRLILISKGDPVQVLQKFISEVDLVMNTGDATKNLQELQLLFSKIFGASSATALEKFIRNKDNQLAFLLTLTVAEREILMRYYTVFA